MEECEEFYHNDVRIDYRIDEDDSEALYADFTGKVCHIELIQNEDADNYGNGEGAEAMKKFIEFVKKEHGVNNFYLFASYDSAYYGKEDENGLARLVNFYRRLGFEDLVGFEGNDYQVDMSMTA